MDFYFSDSANQRWMNQALTDGWRGFSNAPPQLTKKLPKLKPKQYAPKEMLQYCGPNRNKPIYGEQANYGNNSYRSDMSEVFPYNFDKINSDRFDQINLREFSNLPVQPTKKLLKLKPKLNAPKELLQYCGSYKSKYSVCGDSGIHSSDHPSSNVSEALSDCFDQISLRSDTSIDNSKNIRPLDTLCELCYYTECARCDVIGKVRPSTTDYGVWNGHVREMCPLAHFKSCICGAYASVSHKNERNPIHA